MGRGLSAKGLPEGSNTNWVWGSTKMMIARWRTLLEDKNNTLGDDKKRFFTGLKALFIG